MARLFLLIALSVIVVIAMITVFGTMQAVVRLAQGKEDDHMPDTFKRIAYIVLVILMFGVTSGWLGAS